MNISKLCLFFITFLFLIFSLNIAFADYTTIGGNDYNFLLGLQTFDSEIETSTAVKSISNIRTIPLVADIDNDGTDEIIVFNDNSLYIYNSHLLILEAEKFLSHPDNTYPSMLILADLDDNGYLDLILTYNKYHIFFWEYNGTDFINENTFFNSYIAADTNQSWAACDDTRNKCLIAYLDGDYSNTEIDAVAFNRTASGNSTQYQLHYNGDQTQFPCFPNVRKMAIADYDNDGRREFIMSWYKIRPSASEQIITNFLDVEDDLSVTTEGTSTISTTNWISDSQPYCVPDGYYNYISSPIVFNIDGVASNGLETIVAARYDSSGFKMYSIKADYSEYDDYPEASSANGLYLSNIAKADIFSDSGENDFCVLSFGDSGTTDRLLCASEQTSEFLGYGDSEQWEFNRASYTNMSDDWGFWGNIIHFSNQGDISNILSNDLGTFLVDEDSSTLSPLYQNPYTPDSHILADSENSGYMDFLLVTTSNLWYIDDGFSNTGCGFGGGCIQQIYYNPDRSQTWKQNTSVEIRLTLTDVDNDLVAGRAVLYYGDSNEQDSGWSINVSSGTTLSFSFKANTTITGGIIYLQARDDNNPTSVQTLQRTFSVSTSGISFGEATLTEDFEVETPEDQFIPSDLDYQDNSITSGLRTIGELTGLTEQILYLLFLGLIMVAVYIYGLQANYNATGVVAIIGGLGLIIGTLLGILGFVYIIIMVIIGIILASIVLRGWLVGSSGG